jgi:hypothetical protein
MEKMMDKNLLFVKESMKLKQGKIREKLDGDKRWVVKIACFLAVNRFIPKVVLLCLLSDLILVQKSFRQIVEGWTLTSDFCAVLAERSGKKRCENGK